MQNKLNGNIQTLDPETLRTKLVRKSVRVFGLLVPVNTFRDGATLIADKVNGITVQTFKLRDEVIHLGKFKQGKFHFTKTVNLTANI